MAEVLSSDSYIANSSTENGSFTHFADIEEIDFPEFECSDISTSTFANVWKTFKGGMKDGGELGMTLHFAATSFENDFFDGLGTDQWFVLGIPDAGFGVKVPGYIKKVAPEVKLDDIVRAKVTIKVSGEPSIVSISAS